MSFELIVEHLKLNPKYSCMKELVEKQKCLVETIKEGLFLSSKISVENEVEVLILKNYIKYLRKKGDDCFAEELEKELQRKKESVKNWNESIKKETKMLKNVIENLFNPKS